MTSKSPLTIITAILGVFGLGLYLGFEYRSRHASPVGPVTSVAPGEEIMVLRGEVALLRQKLQDQPVANAAARKTSESATAGKPAPAAWNLLADLQQRKLATPGITFVSGSGKLTDAFATLFSLNEAERTALQRGLDQACDQLADLQRTNATTTRGDDGSVTIAIKSFAVEGGRVYDQLMKGFAQTLGAERNAAFVKLGGEQVERALGRFGAPEYVYTFKTKPNPIMGGSTYEVAERHKLPHESGSSNSSYRNWAELQNRLGPVSRLLPPDFARPE
jgi:hypothetical protein